MMPPARRLLLAAWLGWLLAAAAAQAAPAHAHKHAAKPAKSTKSAAKPAAKPVESTPSTVDPDGEGFLKLYNDLCVKRIDGLGAFRRKLLRTGVPKLQPERAKLYLAGLDGDAWPVSYKGKTGNFVLVLSDDNDQCMLYARRTDRVAVEQGFADLVAGARAGARVKTDRRGDALTLSATLKPHGEQHAMRFALTTQAAPDAKLRAVGSVELNPLADPPPPPPKKKARKSAHASSKEHPARKRRP